MNINKVIGIRSLVILLMCSGWLSVGGAACDTPEHRAFDFWLGEWQVKTPDGKIA